jgi:hypothetical protein
MRKIWKGTYEDEEILFPTQQEIFKEVFLWIIFYVKVFYQAFFLTFLTWITICFHSFSMRILSSLMVDNGKLKTFWFSQNWLEKMLDFITLIIFYQRKLTTVSIVRKDWIILTIADKWRRLVLSINKENMETKKFWICFLQTESKRFEIQKLLCMFCEHLLKKHQASPFSSFF